MARKNIGHIELQWRCPNCDHRNLGREKTCTMCGAPQPEDVQFEQLSQQEIIADEALIEQAKAGPDIHCAYCGTRNVNAAKTCVHCGADISEGAKRQAGRVLGAYQSGPAQKVACDACGAENLATAGQCGECGAPLKAAAVLSATPQQTDEASAVAEQPVSKKKPVALIIVAVLICLGMAVVALLSMRSSSVTGTVQQVEWERTVNIEVYGPVERNAWQDELPTGAEDISCAQAYRYTSSTPAENSKEVCGTPYTVDSGSGFAEVVQDCEYQVYDDYCSYTVLDWSHADKIVANGSNLNAEWPSPNLSTDQRLGDQRSETYSVVFQSDNGEYTYTPENFAEYQRFQPGSVWTLDINTFGVVLSVQP